jgi:hypothetical protein
MATSPSYHGNFSDQDQPTLNSVADYIGEARILLQDIIAPYRYDDGSLLSAINIVLLEARRLRADLFVFNLKMRGQTQAFTAVDDTYVDMEPQFRQAILHGICAHALERDQDDVQDARATAFWQLFNAGLVGRTLGGIGRGAVPVAGQAQ